MLVQVTAAGVTPWDHTAATGAVPSAGPLILGNEGAGLVVADPAGRWAPGTRVMFFAGPGGVTGRGTMAEFAVSRNTTWPRSRSHVADEVAAAVPIAYLTAVLALRLGGFSPGRPGLRARPSAAASATRPRSSPVRSALSAVAGSAGSTAKAEAVRAAPWAYGIEVVDLERDRLASASPARRRRGRAAGSTWPSTASAAS